MKTHNIKLSIEFCDAVLSGEKTFEIRENDRGYQKGDKIKFNVVDPLGLPCFHELDHCEFEITYVLSGWGIENGYVALSIKRVEAAEKALKGRNNG